MPLSERNPRVVSAVKLRRGAHRRKTGEFLAEGANAVQAALAAGAALRLFHRAELGPRERALVDTAEAEGVATHLVDDRTARALGDTVTPPGLVAVCRQVDVPLTDVLDRRPTTVVVAVGIGEPGNAGTVIRLADALGADAVIFAGDTVDPHNGKCVRASAGSVFHVPVVRARSIDAALDELDAAGLTLLATTADGELSLDDADAVLAAPSAWLFGSEAHGLDAAVVARADHRVRIPIEGRAESLNLATAAAICLYAAARGRRAASSR